MGQTARLEQIRAALGRRDLIWFGTRATDALPLFALKVPRVIASQVAPLPEDEAQGAIQHCLETAQGHRKDLDRYEIDLDIRQSTSNLKQRILDEATGNDVVVAYRPAVFLATALFCNPSLVPAFNFHLGQRQFEYKPWVEKELAAFAPEMPLLRWTYMRETDAHAVRSMLSRGPLVARNTTGSGGADIFEFSTEEEFERNRPRHRDHFVGICRFVENAIPLNVNACVYRNGAVAVFGVSYQLIGLKGLTKRRFGFGGNDFLAACSLSSEILESIRTTTTLVGLWLAGRGYRGVFGIDFLVEDEIPLVTEVNARFQASTPLGALINQAAGTPDPMTEHVAAFLDMEPPDMPSVGEQVQAAKDAGPSVAVAQVIHRNVREADVYVSVDRTDLGRDARLQGLPGPKILIEQEGMLFKSFHTRSVTRSGYEVDAEVMKTRDAATTRY